MTKITNSALCRFGVALLVAAACFSAQAQTVQTNSSATGYGGGGGSGTVTSMSVASANGLAGTVANPTTTPAITLSTSITGVLKGNGTAVAQAASGSDYVAPTTTVNGHALSANVTVTASDVGLGSVANVDTTNAANITSGTLAAARGGAGATSGVLKANGSGLVSAAVSGTDLKTINSTSIIGSGDIAISGGVTSVAATGANGLGVSGSPITTSGTLALSLGNITPTTVATGTATVSTLTGTGQFETAIGSLTTPAYSNTASTNTGIYFPGNNQVGVVANGSASLTASSSSVQINASQGLSFPGSDLGVVRNAAGILEVNNTSACSTVANCRDIKVRHYLASGTAPTIGGSCGTSPSIVGSDSAAQVTVGTGSPTSCTVTFGTAFANAPVCTANGSGTAGVKVATTTTTVIVSATSLTASEKLQVLCIGI